MDNRKIREIYDYDLLEDTTGTQLTEWYNVVMEKTVGELTVSDVCRMLRQKIFSVVAIGCAIHMLEDDPFLGELYEGQLFITLFNAKKKYLTKRYDDIEKLLDGMDAKAISYNWQDENAKEEYLETIAAFRTKIALYREKEQQTGE